MGLVKSIKFSDLNNDDFLRMDSKFHFLNNDLGWNVFDSKHKELIPLNHILTPFYDVFIYEKEKEYKGIPTGREYLNEYGDIISYKVVTKEEHPNRLKYKVNSNCILISSLKGAKTPALNFDFDLANYVFSNGFYIFNVSKLWNKKFILYILRTKVLKNVLDNHIFRGIGISSYREDDFVKIKIPNISLDIQNEIKKQIKPLEEQIKILKSQKKEHLEIINEVFSNSFDINLDEVKKLENIKQFTLPLRVAHTKNSSLRNSFKWHKLETIQSYMYANIDCIKKLGNCIVQTKNGWSPLSSEVEEGIGILGQEHITKEGKISLKASKFTTVSRNNIEDFYIKKNDFFVSRGNTVELVALASVVLDEVEENILYPDLYIKIDFDDELVYKEYMAFLFNSFFGRIYFGHVAKGKNQTMVKVSAKELYEFYIPLPDISVQQEIVDKIRVTIDSQQHIDKQIEEKQSEISELIESVIRDEK